MNHAHTLWQLVGGFLVVSTFIFFAGAGIAHVVNPDWFIKRSSVRKGGEVLKKWNRDGFRLFGMVFAAFAAYLLYVILRDYFGK